MTIASDVESRLEAAWQRLSSEFDLTQSKVRPGVKTGRSRRGSRLDRYISYKTAAGRNIGLAVFQIGSTGPVICEISDRDTTIRGKYLLRKQLSLLQFDEAIDDLATMLSALGVPKR